VPHINHDSAEFWEGCQQHELRIARCQDCGTWIHLPRRVCPDCWSDHVATEVVDGAGRLLTYSLPRAAADATEVTITGVVALDGADGVRLLTRIVGCVPDEVSIGMPLIVDWRAEEAGTVPQFRPAEVAP
jgi:uncharacterized OB-fold protein